MRQSRMLLHIRLFASLNLLRSDKSAVESLLLGSYIIIVLRGVDPKYSLGSRRSRSARLEEGLSKCLAMEATSVIATATTKEMITY
jgi:hypothetical protein